MSDTNTMPITTKYSDKNARVFVWGIWLIMMLIAITCLIIYGRNIPLTEDWYLVAPLTGNEPNLLNWLWTPNNGHRVPLPRLILLAVLRLAHGDFRAGMFLNVTTLGGMSIASILVARHLRRGHTLYVDAFFPIVMLSLGNWADLFWSWEFTQILPAALGLGFLLVLLCQPTLATSHAAIIAGICLVSLPLCGANGLIFAPLLLVWTIYCSFLQIKTPKTHKKQRWIPIFLLGSVFLTLSLLILYFIGDLRTSGYPPSSGLGATIKTAAQFIAISFGPIAINKIRVSVIVSFVFFISTITILVLEALRHKNSNNIDKYRSLAILLFLAILTLYALTIGYSRAGWLLKAGYYPMWYMIYPMPFLCAAFFAWELYGKSKWRKIFQRGVFVLICILLPLNMMASFSGFGDWYNRMMSTVERDIDARIPVYELAQRHQKNLMHAWDAKKIAAHIEMLCKHRLTAFSSSCKPEK